MPRPASQASQGWTALDEDARSPQPRPNRHKGQLTKLPGGNKALGAFVLSLVAYTLQTECAQYVQQALNYRKPFLSLYLGHSAFTVLFPAHLAILCYSTRYPLSHYLHLISQNLRWQLRTPSAPLPRQGPDAVRRRLSIASGRGVETDAGRDDGAAATMPEWNQVDLEDGDARLKLHTGARSLGAWLEDRIGFDAIRLLGLLAILTLGITVPALSWYSAVPMTSMADITAIYNTFSVWALVFSVWFLGEKWQKRKVFSVLLACFGVVVVAYGGAEHRKQPKELDPVYGKPDAPASNATLLAAETMLRRAAFAALVPLAPRAGADGETQAETPKFSNPMLGNLLALVGAVTMAAYEMAFKLIGTLPDEEKQRDLYSAVGSAQRRRSRSYLEHHGSRAADQAGMEGQGLLDETRRATVKKDQADDVQRHVLGESEDGANDDDDETADIKDGSARDRLSHLLAGERSSIWNHSASSDGDPYSSYQTMTPPAELAADGDVGSADVKKDEGADSNGVRVQARAVQYGDDESDVTESELDEGEAEEIQHGAHRLHRNPSYASTKRQSRHHASAADYHDAVCGDDGDGDDGGQPDRGKSSRDIHRDTSIPPPLPFGLHANLMTSGIGLVTLCCLWLGLPAAHYLGWERFELPPNLWTVFSIGVVVTCGIFFNAAFMILLSLWGPVLASVSCLLTTVLVEIADVLLGRELKLASVLGCALVAAGFGVLVGGGREGLH
ncbi:uncharacterized protein PFL1_05181 [Pseudozyma flocculosa PF-1]|uniref:EamA domain-containing protein n=2 Tax=Pseudozyma flocculosa TaxID=84751 RepID=A0A5C3F563_9BASI|nr:uncharacterized protein PFL1_05181 [Pseudozyma flocculosa PF-1]EPQ27258.1 hypothetical protein PFL1_05181 [Pseudozyma flocculosa PF-1]SPO39628.1 uncharacterized protein PSFLO_05109 [Pseudozyma flocculosa]